MQKPWFIIMEKSNCQKGFTLIEVMIAIFLLTIGILAAGTMQLSSLEGNSHANRITQASTQAGERLETLLAKAYPQDVAHLDLDLRDINRTGLVGIDDTDIGGNLADGGPVINGDLTIFWNVVDNYPINDCKTIRVIVRRSDKGLMKTVAVDYIKMRSL